MKPEEFQKHIARMAEQSEEFVEQIAPFVAGNTAVSAFKQNFQQEGFFGQPWPEVQRRETGTAANKYAKKHHPARTSRKILTGDTADLGRSIEIKKISPGQVAVWSSPDAFGSKEPYGAVHNEGLRAGRGSGFSMPKRQFIGPHPQLDKQLITALQKRLDKILK